MRQRLLLLLPLFALALLLILTALSYSPLRDITTAPVESSAPLSAISSEDSIIALPVRIAFADLQALANQKIPEVLVDKRERKKYKSRILGISIKLKGELRSFIKRQGPVQVRRYRDQLEIVAPLYFKARFEGDDGLDPDASTKGAVDIILRLVPGMTPQWQPTLKASATYRWTRKPKLKVGILRLDAREMLGDALQERLDELCRELEQEVAESPDVRDKVQKRWHEFHQVRQLGDDDTPAWLMVDPKAAYFAPPQVTDDALLLQFALTARLTTLLGTVAPPPIAEPLPDLIIEAPPENGFRIQLPVLLDYAGMTRLLRARYTGHRISLPPGEIELLDFRLYTAGKHLVLGAQIRAQAPGQLLNTQGWLYLQGIPVYDGEAQRLVVEDFGFTRQVDNPLVSSASWVLQDSLRDYLARALSYDLAGQVEAAKTAMHERVNRPIGDGLVMSGALNDLRVAEIQPRPDDLLLLLQGQGQINIHSDLSLQTLDDSAAQASGEEAGTGL